MRVQSTQKHVLAGFEPHFRNQFPNNLSSTSEKCWKNASRADFFTRVQSTQKHVWSVWSYISEKFDRINSQFFSVWEIARKKIFFISERGKGNSKEMSHLSKKLMRRIRHQKFSRQKWRCVKKFWLCWHTNQNPEWFRLCLFSWKYSEVSSILTLWPN